MTSCPTKSTNAGPTHTCLGKKPDILRHLRACVHVSAELAEAAAQELADMNKRSAAQKRAKNAARVAEGRVEQEAAQGQNMRRAQSTYHVQAIPWLQGLGIYCLVMCTSVYQASGQIVPRATPAAAEAG